MRIFSGYIPTRLQSIFFFALAINTTRRIENSRYILRRRFITKINFQVMNRKFTLAMYTHTLQYWWSCLQHVGFLLVAIVHPHPRGSFWNMHPTGHIP